MTVRLPGLSGSRKRGRFGGGLFVVAVLCVGDEPISGTAVQAYNARLELLRFGQCIPLTVVADFSLSPSSQDSNPTVTLSVPSIAVRSPRSDTDVLSTDIPSFL